MIICCNYSEGTPPFCNCLRGMLAICSVNAPLKAHSQSSSYPVLLAQLLDDLEGLIIALPKKGKSKCQSWAFTLPFLA